MSENTASKLIPANKIYQSYRKNREIVAHTPLQRSPYLSTKYSANIFLKREDLQAIRSFKIRGAATAFRYMTEQQKSRGVVTASAGNHAQGIAYCCKTLKVKGTIFMPATTPKLKINSVRHHGGEFLEIIMVGTTFDDAVAEARKYQEQTNAVFIHAFDNINVIQGQGGLAAQILQQWTSNQALNFVFTCVGGGGLASGLGCYLRQMAPEVKLVGFEPLGSPSMYNSLQANQPVVLDALQTFVDGASMKRTGRIPFDILSELKQQLHLINEGLVAKTMLQMYDEQAIILEPAGALSVAGLEVMRQRIVGKNVICILSGSNNDISRLPEVRVRSQIYQNKEAYYVLASPSSLNIRIVVEAVIDPTKESIIFLNTAKKFNSSAGQCLMGLSFFQPENKKLFEERVLSYKYKLTELKANDPLLKILL